MYAIYGNIYHQYTPNVSICTIHGSYGFGYGKQQKVAMSKMWLWKRPAKNYHRDKAYSFAHQTVEREPETWLWSRKKNNVSCPAKESAWILAENRPIYEPIYKLKESNCVLLQHELLRANINIHQFTTVRPNHWKISEKRSWNHDDHGHLTAWFRVRCLVFPSFSHVFPLRLHPDTAEMTNTEMSSFSLGRRQLELFNPGHPAAWWKKWRQGHDRNDPIYC